MASCSPREYENTRSPIMKLPARQSTPSRAAAPKESLGMLTRQEIAKQLRISTRTVDEWRQDKVIPCIKVGKVVLFYWPDVVSALREKYSVASAAQAAKEAGAIDHGTTGQKDHGAHGVRRPTSELNGGRSATRPTLETASERQKGTVRP